MDVHRLERQKENPRLKEPSKNDAGVGSALEGAPADQKVTPRDSVKQSSTDRSADVQN